MPQRTRVEATANQQRASARKRERRRAKEEALSQEARELGITVPELVRLKHKEADRIVSSQRNGHKPPDWLNSPAIVPCRRRRRVS